MIARSRRAWLEPFIWFLPGFIGHDPDARRGRPTGGAEGEIFAFGGVTLVALDVDDAPRRGAARCDTSRRSPRIGIFRSARPNDMVEAGLGRTFQNIRLFQNMTALENVLVGMHSRMKSTWLDAMLSTPRDRREEKAVASSRRRSYLDARRPRAAWTTSWPRTCPTATSAGWRSPGPWRRSRSCSCSTSRRRA